ncbi:MAG: hypothetical protein HUK21_05395 [Fibrobacteraceae bacterium]|nr:hypothetical protein [Fibrobacteraceae bacterium]
MKNLLKIGAAISIMAIGWNCGDDSVTGAPTLGVKSTYAKSINCAAIEKIGKNAWVVKGKDVYLIYDADKNSLYEVRDDQGQVIGNYNITLKSIIGIDLETGATTELVKDVDLSALPIIDTQCDVYGIDGTAYIHEGEPDTTTVDTLPTVESSAATQSSAAPTPKSSQQSTPTSSANTPTSATSSAAAPKSSAAPVTSSAGTSTGSCPTIKYVNGGASGSGWATRYWDCCKPSCSWNENAGGNLARQCDKSGNKINDPNSTSICNGGPASTCVSQIPFTISGCDNIAFAFAAVPASDGGKCGHCYELTFTGKGHYGDDANSKKLKSVGKKLIVMASNVGGDVERGQFDIMIPGGGVGMFNGCSSFGWGAQGAQYGGLLSDCETENNYVASKMQSCLTTKCNNTFKNDAKAKEGCLFLATWMYAARNPEHTFKEVECPQELKNRY